MGAPLASASAALHLAAMTADKDIAWIAGVGARVGLGAALARRFARAGFEVVVTGRSADKLDAVVREVVEAGGQASASVADVSDERAIAEAAKHVSARGSLALAVFNAGMMAVAPSLELSVEDFTRVWKVNTLGGFVFGREALRTMVPAGRGSLIFTGATASLKARPPFAAFAASKAGLRSVAQSFAREFGPRGVHVAHVVIDGAIDGERVRSAAPERVAKLGPDGLLDIDAIAEVYHHLHTQPRSAWTHELDLRPFKEPF
ncbi:MAG TPA: SDR family NAD(P)-dependent oxidoreductase [Polyangiales bacterium]|nr:SDR family NAD(P)-dependent oxidoreductase [Polyangiales bacterium]